MKNRSAITFGPVALGLSVLLLGGVTATGLAVASDREQSRAEKHGRVEAAAAQHALAKGKLALAIRHAEAAVAFQPNVAAYRLTLGQTYLKAGRFASARDAFADALTLDQGDGKAALNFALAQIATGDWAAARKTLDAHVATIPVGDRALAIALTGDPATAVELLGAAARAPDADAKIRQNYALSLALAGRWREAQTVVAIDLSPADVTQRILQWSTFSRPKSASDQVATLLGVTPAVDPGLPVALALNNAVTPAVAVAAAAPVEPVTDTAAVATQPTPTPEPVVAEAAPVATPVGPTIAGVTFAERKEVVQAIPTSKPLPAAHAAITHIAPEGKTVAAKVAVPAMPRPVAKGNFYVQVGAYESANVARDAWLRASRRFAGFAGHTPQGMNITAHGASFYRLSLGGFARADAVSLCEGYRAKGGKCFVRAGAGDQVALWAKGRELASR